MCAPFRNWSTPFTWRRPENIVCNDRGANPDVNHNLYIQHVLCSGINLDAPNVHRGRFFDKKRLERVLKTSKQSTYTLTVSYRDVIPRIARTVTIPENMSAATQDDGGYCFRILITLIMTCNSLLSLHMYICAQNARWLRKVTYHFQSDTSFAVIESMHWRCNSVREPCISQGGPYYLGVLRKV